ncbi:anthranilate/aminodeoxychorismate synthase component II [Longibacter salinarum]|uniref:Anthranilate/aminodeoxychorismate synthase component II n=1 Tax=Longibacter salinarum TaxID=1850348 RepID=A0A2A8CWC3_9BACT|nr:aminodeoxychorismate/anthranilate synthase component II [Longibacter salinarum]PEN12894.1 anthranilate/aminodeoxychorismate synthase component II [Longibacter salinarum]
MILIIDNYDSFTYNLVHLVGRHTDDLEVIRNDDRTLEEVRDMAPDGILISPGPGRPREAGITEGIIEHLGADIPIFGVCLGHQAIGEVFGGSITHARELMHGKTSTVTHDGHSVFDGVEQNFEATRYHSLVVDRESIPDVLEITAETDDGTVMGLRHRDHPIESIQFHPESVLTKAGPRIIANWLRSIGSIDLDPARSS